MFMLPCLPVFSIPITLFYMHSHYTTQRGEGMHNQFSKNSSQQEISKLLITVYQTSPGFYVSAVQVFRKHSRKRRNCL